MREFGVTFSEGLRKGLRAFNSRIQKKEELIECFNFMPHELGLIAHEEIENLPDLVFEGPGEDIPPSMAIHSIGEAYFEYP